MTSDVLDQPETIPPTVFLKAVFHVHTSASHDCQMTPQILVERCFDHGIDLIAVTDHNTLQGAIALQRVAPFPVIVGEEIRTAEGAEVIGLFLTDTIEKEQPAHAVVAAIRAQGGLVYIPHPYDPIRTRSWPAAVREELLSAADIIETFNARNLLQSANRQAAAAAQRLGKAACAGADAHLPGEIGRTVVFHEPFDSGKGLLESLRSARLHCVPDSAWIHAARAWNALTR